MASSSTSFAASHRKLRASSPTQYACVLFKEIGIQTLTPEVFSRVQIDDKNVIDETSVPQHLTIL